MSTIVLHRDVPVPMGDGVITTADVWCSADAPPGPAILVRTPYLKEQMTPSVQIDPRQAADRGYAVVVQDVRGTGGSGGQFTPFVDEVSDGSDTIRWLIAQPWCDGRVVMLGMSYVGATQWLAACARPPGLAGIAPTLSSDHYGEGWTYTNGVAELGFVTSWSAAALAPVAQRWLDDVERAYRDHDELATIAPWTRDWLGATAEDSYWTDLGGHGVAPELPAYIVAGWYDIFCSASIASFQRRQHPHDRLVIGPWAHDPELSHLVGDRNVGIAGAGAVWGFAGKALDWYDAVLDGRAPSTARVTAYLLGARRWLSFVGWPPDDARPVVLALEGAGGFDMRADDPAPSIGGRGLQVFVPGSGFGIRDQRPLAAHPATLTLDVAPRPDAEVWAGPAKIRLRVAAEGDGVRRWTATLCQRAADDRLDNLAEGIAEAPAGAEDVEIPLGHVFVQLEPGASLCVIVAGASFPRWPAPTHDGRYEVLPGCELDVLEMAPP